MKAISLFSCGGIGDLALRESGIDTVIANEIIEDRAEVFKYNHPNTEMIKGDIYLKKEDIIKMAKKYTIDVVFATPPCQGMSKNGKGKLLQAIRKGIAPKVDPRNLLIVPAIEITKKVCAHTLILENVPEMLTTYIPHPKTGEFMLIVDYICSELPEHYCEYKVVNFADYGIAQSRERLIAVFSKKINLLNSVFPKPTHSKNGSIYLEKWVSLKDVIGGFPYLDSKSLKTSQDPNDPLHRVPLLDENKYFWVKHTPENKSAFDNQCIKCGFNDNPLHSSKKNNEGINKSSTETPIYCLKCGELLPRPWVLENGNYRLMKGYISAYKRMKWDSPSSTITTNFSYACSDNKLHPEQNRVLSIAEVMAIHSLDCYNYQWKRKDRKKVTDSLIRSLIGESIPPKGLAYLLKNIVTELNKTT